MVDSLTGRHWVFNNAGGAFKVNSTLEDPWGRKPDWAFIEEGEKIPKDPAAASIPNAGEFAMALRRRLFIHARFISATGWSGFYEDLNMVGYQTRLFLMRPGCGNHDGGV